MDKHSIQRGVQIHPVTSCHIESEDVIYTKIFDQILLCEKAFWILLRPIRGAKRASHM